MKKSKNHTGKNACATRNPLSSLQIVAPAFLPVWFLNRFFHSFLSPLSPNGGTGFSLCVHHQYGHAGLLYNPPSTQIVCPVTKALASLAKNVTPLPTSSGVPTLPSGVSFAQVPA